MGELASFVEKHPWAIGVAVLIVAALAYLQRPAASGSSGDVTFTGGGVIAPPQDPNAAATDQARIGAGVQNFSTLAQLVLGENTNSSQLQLGQSETAATLAADEAEVSANLTAQLAATTASQETQDAATSASVTINGQNANAAVTAAQITAATQAAVADANSKAAAAENAYQLSLAQFQKDQARAADNTSIVNNLVDEAGKVISFISLGFL